MAFKTNKTVYSELDQFFVGADSYDATTLPSNEITISANDGASNDQFGRRVAVGNNRMVSASYFDDDAGQASGSAYIFDLDGNQLAKITASDATSSDQFGHSVSIGHNRIVVGARYKGTNGSIYIFDLVGNELKIVDAQEGGAFGYSVSVGSGRIVVGDAQSSESGSLTGSAWILDLEGNFLTKLTADNPQSGDWFGIDVASGCGRIVVGAHRDDGQGAAYIFDLNGNLISKITSNDISPDDQFGVSVAVGSGRIVVGANGDDDNGSSSGSAYIFDLDGNQLAKITASDAAADDQFGGSVAVGDGRILVGAIFNNTVGSVYVFDLDGNEIDKIEQSSSLGSRRFGSGVGIGSGRIIVGAPALGTGFAKAYSSNSSQTHYLEQLD